VGQRRQYGAPQPRATALLKCTAVEHQQDWAVRVRRELVRRGIDWATVEYIPAETSFKEGIDDGDEATFERYVRSCQLSSQRLDAAIVDGRARVACAQRVWPQIADSGFIALHDAQRPEYAAARPIGSSLVRLRDARRQFDGGDVQLDLYFKTPAQARKLAARLAGRLHSAVTLSVEEGFPEE
jgi:hypothetical protein